LSKSSTLRFGGVILLALGAAGSQILSTLGAGIVFVELLRRGMRAVISDGRKEVVWRVAVVLVPPLVSIGVLLLMRYGMGYEDYASRSIGFSSPTALGWLKDKAHVYSDAYANLYQAPIGVAFGSSIALQAFKAALALPIIFLYFLFVSSGLTKAKALMYALGPLAAFCVALAPLLGATALPFGYRIVGAPFVLYIFCLSTVLIPIWHVKTMPWIVGALAVVSAISIWASSTDVSVREVALKRDYEWLADTGVRMKETGATEVRLCSQPFVKPTMFNEKAERGILVSYSPMSVDAHSVWYNHFLFGFLKVNGVKSSVVESDQRRPQCVQSCQAVGRRSVGNFLTHFDEASSSLFMCTK